MNSNRVSFVTIYATFSLLVLTPLLASNILEAQNQPQYTPVVTRDPAALQLLQQCWTAMGSPDPNLPFRADANITPLARGGSPAQVTIQTRGASRLRVDTTRDGRAQVFVVADGQGFMSQDKRHNSSSYSASRYPHSQFLPYSTCSSPIANPELSIFYVGADFVEGVAADHILVYMKSVDTKQTEDPIERSLSEEDIFLSRVGSLPLRVQSYSFGLHDATNSVLWTTDYVSYAEVDGIKLPATTVEWLGHQRVRQYNWTSIEVNAAIDSETFAIGK
jgi:hypothetical protein